MKTQVFPYTPGLASKPKPNYKMNKAPVGQLPWSSSSINTRKLARASSEYHLFVTPLVFASCWWMVCFFHTAEIAFLFGTTRLYYWFLNDGGAAGKNLIAFVRVKMSYHTLAVLNWFFSVVGALHLIAMVRILYRSFNAHQLTFSKHEVAAPRATNGPQGHYRPLGPHISSRAVAGSVSAEVFSWLDKQHSYIMKKYIEPVFLIDGEYFDDYFLAQECTEVICQVYQAYQISIYVATRWINNLIVIMIFLNCISTPFIHWRIPASNKPLRRLISVIVSSLLNFVNSVVIPLVIFVPYARAYDPALLFFPKKLSWDDVWYSRALRENQQVLVTSYIDFFTTLVPHLSLLDCLLICGMMLHRRQQYATPGATANVVGAVVPAPNAPVHRQLVVSSATAKAIQGQSRSCPSSKQTTRDTELTRLEVFNRNAEFILHTSLCLAGIIVLGIHIAAQHPHELVGCKLGASPWFGVNTSCSVMNVNCYQLGIEGQEQQIDEILNQLNRDTIFNVLFSHCPRFQMPRSLRNLRHLVVMELYNSTLDRWDMNASLRGDTNPMFSSLTISRSRLAGIPDGLLDPQFPKTLAEIIVYESNLTTVPDEIAELWRPVVSFWCVLCEFKTVPASLAAIQQQVMLSGNAFRSIDFDIFDNPNLYSLDFTNTSLAVLPNTTKGTLHDFYHVDLDATQLNYVPAYIRQWYKHQVDIGGYVDHHLFGSPYCSRVIEEKEEQWYQQQVCASQTYRGLNPYPIDIIIPQRPL